MFDFDGLDEAGSPTSSAPQAEDAEDDHLQVRWQRLGVEPAQVPRLDGISAEGALDEMEALSSLRAKDLQRECERAGIPIPAGAEKGELLKNLRQVFVWKCLDVISLKDLVQKLCARG
ncbi:Ank2 [Symbiodinium natans]|uniref:Ank2 protein n=1 Tax=Symbiodinium natans TaxID=878477 RepID=A0A812SKS8_9DINO|nr:Ank2 [Symbiodinium natans]